MGLFGTRKPPLAVQCGNCMNGLPAGLATCPECGVAFEEEIAKCSHCASWIPANAAQCPKCKTEFKATFRSQWQMRSNDRRILLPKTLSAAELEEKVRERQKATPRIVEEPGAAQRGGPAKCPSCGSTGLVTLGGKSRCRVCLREF